MKKGIPHKKSNQGFASDKYDGDIKKKAQIKGGKAKVAKGFALMSKEKRVEIARKGGRS